MEAAIALVASCLFSYAGAGLLKKAPIAFYVAFALVGALFAAGVVASYAPALNMALVPYLRRASLAFGLFSVVMFIGVLPESNAVRKRLAPVRGTLSLIALILVAVHIVGYAATYWASMAGGAASPWIAFGFVMGAIVTVLLLVLGVTSVSRVRTSMDGAMWKRIQRLAYPFYLLMYAHLAAMLVPSSLAGGNSLANLVVYTVVVVAYVVLRVMRGLKARA